MASIARASEVKTEGVLRGACAALAAAAAVLVALSTETETVVLVRKKATAKDVQALWVLAMAAAAAAGYHLLQLLKCLFLGQRLAASPCCRKGRALAWTCLLLDKACAYTTFATTVAAAQACMIALDGAHALQWTKLCNIYTRFCEQIAGSLALGMLAAVGTAVASAVSARNVFRLYSPSSSQPWAAGH